MRTLIKRSFAALFILSLAANSYAHRAWILPGATVLSGDDPWVTLDAAISNDIFHTDYHAMRLDDVNVTSPKGVSVALQNAHTGKYRSSFDLNLTEPGTYRIYTASNGLLAQWLSDDGQRRRWPGRGEAYTDEGFQNNVPSEASDLRVTQVSRRIETFVTAGAPTEPVLAPNGSGLELVPVTHPNDLFADETAEFQFVIDGEPAAGTQVVAIAAGMRYRNSQDAIELTADEQGKVSITWPQAGMYWLSATYTDERAAAPATQRSGAYTGVFEVLPL